MQNQLNAIASVGDQLDEFDQEGFRESLDVFSHHVNKRVTVAVLELNQRNLQLVVEFLDFAENYRGVK